MDWQAILAIAIPACSGASGALLGYLSAKTSARNDARGLFVREFEKISEQLEQTRQAERDERLLRQNLEDEVRRLKEELLIQRMEIENLRRRINTE